MLGIAIGFIGFRGCAFGVSTYSRDDTTCYE